MGVVALAVLGLIFGPTQEERAQIQARAKEAEREEIAQAKEAEKEKIAQGLHCIVAADEPTRIDGQWFCQYCSSFAVDAAIKARLRSSSSYDSGTLTWSPTDAGEFLFVQDFTAVNAYNVELDMKAIGAFNEGCEVTKVVITE